MSNKRHLVLSIIQFLTDEIQTDSLSTDSKESIEGFINFSHFIHI
jgi:hypothetical protein